MKKHILAVLPLLLLSLTAFAQLEKGTILLGGGLGYSSSGSVLEDTYVYSEVANSSFSFGPHAGYFFNDNWAVGLSLPLLWQTADRIDRFDGTGAINETRTNTKTSAYGFAPFVRKYFPFGEKMALYGELGAGYIFQSSETSAEGNTTYSNTSDTNSFRVSTGLGLSYFPKNWLGINLAITPLTYAHSVSETERPDYDQETKSHDFDFGFDTSAISLGLSFFLTKQ